MMPSNPAGDPEKTLDPDEIDRLLAALEKQMDNLPSDNPAVSELRQEIETFRTMVESLHSNEGWSGEAHRADRAIIRQAAERLRGRFVADSDQDAPL